VLRGNALQKLPHKSGPCDQNVVILAGGVEEGLVSSGAVDEVDDLHGVLASGGG